MVWKKKEALTIHTFAVVDIFIFSCNLYCVGEAKGQLMELNLKGSGGCSGIS